MSSFPLLLDEDVPEFLADELIRHEPALNIVQVGMAGAPPKGTKDPQLLLFAEQHQMVLVTMDKKSMPPHMASHFSSAHHTCGVLLLRQDFPIVRYAEDLILIWSTLDDRELIDYSMYLPLQ